MRKWGERVNKDREMKWKGRKWRQREISSLKILSPFPLFPLIFPQLRAFVASIAKILTYKYWGNNLGTKSMPGSLKLVSAWTVEQSASSACSTSTALLLYSIVLLAAAAACSPSLNLMPVRVWGWLANQAALLAGIDYWLIHQQLRTANHLLPPTTNARTSQRLWSKQEISGKLAIPLLEGSYQLLPITRLRQLSHRSLWAMPESKHSFFREVIP